MVGCKREGGTHRPVGPPWGPEKRGQGHEKGSKGGAFHLSAGSLTFLKEFKSPRPKVGVKVVVVVWVVIVGD